jgi:hypothetical protein
MVSVGRAALCFREAREIDTVGEVLSTSRERGELADLLPQGSKKMRRCERD